MPSTRRSTGTGPGNTTAASRSKPSRPANQTKLAFSNRVTKSNAIDTASALAKSKSTSPAKPRVSRVAPSHDDDEEEPASADVALESIDSAAKAMPPPELDPLEAQARKVSEAQIKQFYNAQERARKAPRIHQADIAISERLLRSWDVDSRYGPCIGIDRTKRWKRAHKFGLSPPLEILAVLLNEQDASGKRVQRAHLDEIMASKFAD